MVGKIKTMGGTIARSTGVIGQRYYPLEDSVFLLKPVLCSYHPTLPFSAPPHAQSPAQNPRRPPQHGLIAQTLALRSPCHLHNRNLHQTPVPHIHPLSLPLPYSKGTLLGILSTDALISHSTLHLLPASAIDKPFNSISVNGNMSTNDTVPSSPNAATVRIEI